VFAIQRILLQVFANSLQHSGAREIRLEAHANGAQRLCQGRARAARDRVGKALPRGLIVLNGQARWSGSE